VDQGCAQPCCWHDAPQLLCKYRPGVWERGGTGVCVQLPKDYHACGVIYNLMFNTKSGQAIHVRLPLRLGSGGGCSGQPCPEASGTLVQLASASTTSVFSDYISNRPNHSRGIDSTMAAHESGSFISPSQLPVYFAKDWSVFGQFVLVGVGGCNFLRLLQDVLCRFFVWKSTSSRKFHSLPCCVSQ
jgi:hypothetical protein